MHRERGSRKEDGNEERTKYKENKRKRLSQRERKRAK
jgi:hypothetical protein